MDDPAAARNHASLAMEPGGLDLGGRLNRRGFVALTLERNRRSGHHRPTFISSPDRNTIMAESAPSARLVVLVLCLTPVLMTGCQLGRQVRSNPAGGDATASAPGSTAAMLSAASAKQSVNNGPNGAAAKIANSMPHSQRLEPATEMPSPEQEFNFHMQMSKIYELRSDFSGALAAIDRALTVCERAGAASTRPKDPMLLRAYAYRRAGQTLDALCNFKLSEVQYRKALELVPNDPATLNDLGYSYYVQNRLKESEDVLRKVVAMLPHDTRARTNLGMTLAATGRETEALEHLVEAGGEANAQAILGYVAAARGQVELARGHYGQALELDPDLQRARSGLAQLDKIRANQNARPPAAPATATATDPEVELATHQDAQIPSPSKPREPTHN